MLEKRVCPVCGYELLEHEDTCIICGKKFDVDQEPKQQQDLDQLQEEIDLRIPIDNFDAFENDIYKDNTSNQINITIRDVFALFKNLFDGIAKNSPVTKVILIYIILFAIVVSIVSMFSTVVGILNMFQ